MSDQTSQGAGPVLYVAIDQRDAAGIAKAATDMITDPYAVIVFANVEGTGAVVLHTSAVDRAELQRAYEAAHPQIGAALAASRAHHN